MTAIAYRARSGTELIDAGFRLVTSHFAPLVTIAALGYAPSSIARLLMRNSSAAVVGVGVLLVIVGFVTAIMANGALIHATSEVYLGHTIDVGESLRVGRKAFRSLANVSIGKGVLIMLGFILFIVPGVILIARFFVASAVVVLEGTKGIGAVLDRSSKLCQDAKLRILGCVSILGVFYVIGIATISVIALVTKSTILVGLLWLVILAFVGPLYCAFVTLQYYDARIRKEGYDMELLAGSMAPPPAPVAA